MGLRGSGSAVAVCCFVAVGGMFFGFDQGVTGGLLVMESFDHDFCPETRLPSGKSGCAGIPTPPSWAWFTTFFSVMYYIGCVFGAMGASEINDRCGRRASVFFASLSFSIGTVVCCVAPPGAVGRAIVLTARVAAGLGVGAASFSLPIYAAEAAPEHQRGLLSGMMQLAVVIGLLIAGVANRILLTTTFGWRISLSVALIPPLALIAGIWCVPESPRWLLRNKGSAAARASLLRLRGDGSGGGPSRRFSCCANRNRGASLSFDEAGAMQAAAAAIDAELAAMVTALADERADAARVAREKTTRTHPRLLSDDGNVDPSHLDIGVENERESGSPAAAGAPAGARAAMGAEALGDEIASSSRSGRKRRCCCCGGAAAGGEDEVAVTFCDVFAPRTRKRAFIAMALMVGQEGTGINPILTYGGLIFQGVTGDGALALIYLYTVNAVVTLPALLLVDRLGRRFLLLLGSCGMFAGLVAAGTLFAVGCKSTVDADGGDAVECDDGAAAMMVACTCFFVAMFAISWGPCCWIYPAEIFPLATRSKAVSLSTMCNWLGGVVLMGVQLLFPLLTIPGTFFLFAAFCASGGVFVFFACPETRSVPLEQIEGVFLAFKPCNSVPKCGRGGRRIAPPLSEQLRDDDEDGSGDEEGVREAEVEVEMEAETERPVGAAEW